MIRKDTSSVIRDGACYYYDSPTSLRVYKNNSLYTYYDINDNYVLAGITTNVTPVNRNCLTYDDIKDISASTAYVEPLYWCLVALLSIIILWSGFSLLIKPFLRRRVNVW